MSGAGYEKGDAKSPYGAELIHARQLPANDA